MDGATYTFSGQWPVPLCDACRSAVIGFIRAEYGSPQRIERMLTRFAMA